MLTTPKEEVSILTLIAQQYPEYKPTDKEKEVINAVFNKFRLSADDRNRNFEYFDGLDLIDYINDSVRRFTTNIDERDGLEDWQARVHDQFTRNKVVAILGKSIATLPIAQFKSRGDEDIRKGILLTNMYEYVEEKEEYDEIMSNLLLESIVKGTAIGYEGVIRDECKIRNIEGVGDDIKVTTGTEKYTRFPTVVVPLEDFYPSSVQIRTIKEMPYCFWRSVVPYSTFLQDWGGMYEQSKFVVPKFSLSGTNISEQKPFYFDFISSDITEGMVEILRYYDKQRDEFVIIANGVWLNPLDIPSEGTKEISPVPFNHKQLPFFEIKFDFFGDWFYGKSLPDKLKSYQDVLNVLTNMLLDQSFLTVFPPLLTNGSDSIEDDYLRPGRRTPVDTQGLSLNESFMKLDLGVPTSWHQFILDYTKARMEEASLDQVSSGQAGVGGRTTAQEISTAAAATAQTLGVFAMLVKYGLKRKASLKAANILQFGTDEKMPLVEKVLGGKNAAKLTEYFNVIKMDDTYLTGGKRGTKIIEMYADKSKMPSKERLQAREMLTSAETGKNTEIVAITPESIRHFDYDVVIVPNPKLDSTKELTKALQLEKVRVYMSFFPGQIDVNELAAQTAEVMGDDPSKILKADVINPQPAPQEANGQQMSTEPQGDVANNMVRGSQGGEQASNQMQIMMKGGLGG
jgi:hypothetical protein